MIRSGTHLDRAFVLNLRAQEVYRPWQGRDSAVTSALLRVLSSAHQGVRRHPSPKIYWFCFHVVTTCANVGTVLLTCSDASR
jgi:hypothetical protein